MEINSELKMVFANQFESINSIEVTYQNGDTICGFIKSMKFAPFEVYLCQHRVLRGENPYHFLDFDNAVSIKIEQNGETKIFE